MTHVWLLVIVLGSANVGRTVGPFESLSACEQAQAQMQQQWISGQRVGVCARVMKEQK